MKRKAAAVTAFCFLAAITLGACGHDPLTDLDDMEMSETTEGETEEETEEETTEECMPPQPVIELGTGGDTFTVASWNYYDAPILLGNWLGVDADDVKNSKGLKTPWGSRVKFVCFNTFGANASECYDNMVNKGDDLDVFLIEPDWALPLLNDDTRTAPLSALGFTENDTNDMYPFTVEQGRNNDGVLKALTWTASSGCFVYNADLAEQYLGVLNTEEMQQIIRDWDSFAESAAEVAERSNGKVALADSVDGMWQAYSCNMSMPLVVDNQLVLGDEVKRFADMAKKLWDCGGVSACGQWSDDWYTSGREGSTMGYFTPIWAFADDSFIMEASDGEYSWSVCEGPAPYWWGGTLIAVDPHTDNGDEARDFIVSAVLDRENLRKCASQDAYLPNSVTESMELASEGFVYSSKVSEHFGGQCYFEPLITNARSLDLKHNLSEYDSGIKSSILKYVVESYLKEGYSWDETVSRIDEDVCYTFPTLDASH